MPRDPVVGTAAPLRRQLVSFAAVGAVCTLVYLVGFIVLAGPLPVQLANALSLLLSALVNTAANRRLTFGVTGRARALRDHLQGIAVYAVGLAITAASLAALAAARPAPSAASQAVVLILATAVATATRFVLLRNWVFAPSVRRPREQLPSFR